MLLAHLVPGYFAAEHSRSGWRPQWSRARRVLLWTAALGSTAAPDYDVFINILSRGVYNHAVLWTHSLFTHLGVSLCWWLLRRSGRWPYLQTLVGLVALGGLSHLVLDVVAHGTPLLYPLSSHLIGIPPSRIVEGGLWAYVTDPLFLLEPLMIGVAVSHWIIHRNVSSRTKKLSLLGVAGAVGLFAVLFLSLLPKLQAAAAQAGLL